MLGTKRSTLHLRKLHNHEGWGVFPILRVLWPLRSKPCNCHSFQVTEQDHIYLGRDECWLLEKNVWKKICGNINSGMFESYLMVNFLTSVFFPSCGFYSRTNRKKLQVTLQNCWHWEGLTASKEDCKVSFQPCIYHIWFEEKVS